MAISQNGAAAGWWLNGGRQILFLGGDLRTMMRVDVESGPTLRVGTPQTVALLPPGGSRADITPDGQRFLALVPDQSGTGSITLVQNWRAALEENR
jgi:hypothetical protein